MRSGYSSGGYTQLAGPHVHANEATNRYEHAIIALLAGPCTTQLAAGVPSMPPGGAGWPYVAMSPAFAKWKAIIMMEPARKTGRRPTLSM